MNGPLRTPSKFRHNTETTERTTVDQNRGPAFILRSMISNKAEPPLSPGEQYRVGTLEKALTVLELLEKGPKPLSIQEISLAAAIQRAAVYRMLCTFQRRGYVERLENKKYRSTSRRRRIQIGYCAPLAGSPFRVDVAASLRDAAARSSVDLLVVDNNEEDPEASLRNAQLLVDVHVDLAIMFQPVEWIGHTMADRLLRAAIPFIAVEIPLHGGVYFGANNYRAGRLAGQTLGRFADKHWKGRYDRVVLVESSLASTTVPPRLAGVLVGLGETLGMVDETRVTHLDGRSHLDASREAMSEFLARSNKGEKLLIACFNDPAAIGTLRAVRAAGREKDVAIVGQNATQESREEIRNPRSRFIASIAYFPERYGDKLIRLATSMLNREPVPPAVYIEHLVIDSHNVEKFYGEK
jgi:ribose transport system substrate-binding protein